MPTQADVVLNSKQGFVIDPGLSPSLSPISATNEANVISFETADRVFHLGLIKPELAFHCWAEQHFFYLCDLKSAPWFNFLSEIGEKIRNSKPGIEKNRSLHFKLCN